MKIERIRENGKYAGSITIMNNGDRIRRDAEGNRTMSYKASNGQVRDGKGHYIGKIK